MAISVNGYIAGLGDDTDWVSDTDWSVFSGMVRESGFIVMGRVTYEASGSDFPYEGAINVVITRDKSKHKQEEDIIFTDRTPKEIIQMATEKGYDQILLIGGGQTNALFMNERLVDEIVVSVHPIMLAGGVHLFEGLLKDVNLKFKSMNQLQEDLVQLNYTVVR